MPGLWFRHSLKSSYDKWCRLEICKVNQYLKVEAVLSLCIYVKVTQNLLSFCRILDQISKAKTLNLDYKAFIFEDWK